MALFNYRAKDSKGNLRSGTIDAKNISEAKAKVQRMRLKLVSIKAQISKDNDSDGSETPIFGEIIYRDQNGSIQISLGRQLPKTKELIVFTKQFATMLHSGVPMVQSLAILASQQSSRYFRKTLNGVRGTVENGGSLSHSLSQYPEIFDNLYVAMVEAGEASGKLDTILLKLVTYIEKASRIKAQVKSAMMYPIIVVLVAVVIVGGLLVFVVPTFAQQYAETGRDLPELTQIVIDLSEGLQKNWVTILATFGVFLGLSRLWISTKKGRRMYDYLVLKFPGIGDLRKKISVGRFCSTMASMLSAGVNLLDALIICANSSGNMIIQEFILNVKKEIENGLKLSEPLSKGNLIPDMVVSMVAVGESTGCLDDMLAKVSEFYEEEVDLAVQGLLSMIEPILIITIGSIVGFIVVAMYLPVFEMASGAS